MFGDIFYESIDFNESRNFNTSRFVSADYIGRQHWHPFVEILFSVSGENEVRVNDSVFSMGINDILMIYPGDLHTITRTSGESLWVLQFSKNLLDILYDLRGNISLLSQYRFWRYSPSALGSERLVLPLKELFEISGTEMPFCEVRMYSLLLEFFREVGGQCISIKQEDTAAAGGSDIRNVRKIADICLFISQNCTSPLTLDEAAAYSGFSRSYFSHLFRLYTGSTFVDYLTEERVKLAKTHFRDSEVSITDIAFESGFSSISSFNRSFRKVTGLSPSEFRESMVTSVT